MSENAVQEETKQERQTFKVNSRTFYVDSLTQTGNELIQSIQTIDRNDENIQSKLKNLSVQSSINKIAREALIDKLEEETVNFEEIKEVE